MRYLYTYLIAFLCIAGLSGTALQAYAQQREEEPDAEYVTVDSVAAPTDSSYEVVYDEDGYTEQDYEDYDFYFSVEDSAATVDPQTRRLTASEWAKLRSDPELKYKKETKVPEAAPPQTNSGSNAWFDFIEGLFEFFGGTAGKVILWLIVGLVVSFVIYQVVENNGLNIFARKDRKIASGSGDEMADDFIPESWEAIIHRAEQDGNYRLAIRHSYRHVLLLMHEKGLLDYSPAQSNYAYVTMLRDKPVYTDFVRLLRHYEFAWYGGFEINAAAYGPISAIYRDLKQKI